MMETKISDSFPFTFPIGSNNMGVNTSSNGLNKFIV